MDEQELIRRSQEGDGEAFGLLIERYKTKVFHLAYGLTRDRATADDLAQEVFIKAYYALPNFKFKSEFGTWLYRVAANHIKDYLRKHRAKRQIIPLQEVEQILAAEEELDGREKEETEERQRKMLQAALGRLPEKYQVILALRDIEGLPYEEISRILKMSPGTVDSRLHRARKKLREELAGSLSREGGENGL